MGSESRTCLRCRAAADRTVRLELASGLWQRIDLCASCLGEVREAPWIEEASAEGVDAVLRVVRPEFRTAREAVAAA